MSSIYFERLHEKHNVQSFENESEYIRWWLAEQALISQIDGDTQTFVAISEGDLKDKSKSQQIAGYFTLSTGIMKPTIYADADTANGWPVVIIQALGRDRHRRGQFFGDLLLIEALRYSHAVSRITGLHGVYLYALAGSESLYDRLGFEHFEGDRRKRWLPISIIAQLPVIHNAPVQIVTRTRSANVSELTI